jgi:hypothetical protein
MRIAAILSLLLLAEAASAQCPSDVQADVRASLAGRARFETKLAPGDARMVGRVRPLRGGETVLVELGFDYRIPEDTIAFDEIICEIEVTVADAAGNEVARSVIDPNDVNLNPNRVPLFYATTLYVGEGTAVRVRIRGNYE